ncbi:tetratricopeptide repeat protein [Ideonella azotifigens]|uniref:Non-specific serine/threonine protein kinase n=2 Tax=Ideonella azotifigens TaxID=513160 RepID=A0ABN1JHY8_9BURK|nr:tetratricopeptide repeat protein [Ideonella azotifigens]MCD2343567.1 tetratricopeptide repeat protein [Ideonella azotifigens]
MDRADEAPSAAAELLPLLWRVGAIEFDESSFELRVHGEPVRAERVPLKVLQRLLRAEGQVVSADELLASIWHRSRDTISRNAVSNAVAKLRRALGNEAAQLIGVLPQTGYRLLQPASASPVAPPPTLADGLLPGRPVPHAPGWLLQAALRAGQASAVWTALHADGRQAVFKFALHADLHLQGLRRELHIARVLATALGERPAFLQPLDANLTRAPYFVCTAYAGPDLLRWAARAGGLAKLPLAQRLAALAAAAEAMAAAHSVGVLHKDLKPDNLLLDETPGAAPQVHIIDFGSGQLPELPPAPGERASTLAVLPEGSERRTLMYLAPERLVGRAATVASDVYAFGVMLYQLVVADFDRPISPSWEADVTDPLLREDIGLATQGDPAQRMASLQELARRLQSLPQRQAQLADQQRREQDAQRSERLLAASRARRPWVIAASALFVAGTAASLFFAREAGLQRDEAVAQHLKAQSVTDFIAVGFLQAANPALGGDHDITLRDAMRRAGQRLDVELKGAPATAAAMHQAIGNNFLALLELDDAVPHFQRALEIGQQTHGDGSDAVLNARCDLGGALLMRGDLAAAQPLAEQARAALASPASALSLATRCKCHQLLGNVANSQNQPTAAAAQFRQMAELAEKNPSATPRQRGLARAVYGQSLVTLGQLVEGKAILHEVAQDFERQFGADQFDTLSARYMLAQAEARMGELASARAAYVQIIAIYQRRFGSQSPLVQHISKELAALPPPKD